MIAIIDYGMGNLYNVKNALDALGVDSMITSKKEDLQKADKLILPGVGAMQDCMLNLEKSGLKEMIIDFVLHQKKPLLGICLGMQALSKMLSREKRIGYDNTIKNDTLINHLEPNKDYVHSVIIDKNSKLYSIIGEEKIWVNSRHSYHVPELDNNLICARSSDGLIEGVELKDKKFIIGVQWHPESNLEDKHSKKLFKSFFDNFKYSQKFH